MAHGSRTLPPIDAIAAALAARAHGSFTAAADVLGVTHAAVSRRVAVAERWAGGRLFERHGRGVRTTPEGERLLARLDAMLDGIDQLADRGRASPRRRSVRVATTPSFARFRLLPSLGRIEGDDLRVEIVADLRNADLRGAGIDLAIRYGRGNWRTGEETVLTRAPLVPVARRALAEAMTTDAAGLASLPWIHDADPTLWRAWCVTHGIERRSKAGDRTLFDYASALAAAEAGLGVALFDTALHGLDELTDSMIALPDVSLDDPPLGYWAIVPLGAGPHGRTVLDRLGAAHRATELDPGVSRSPVRSGQRGR